MNRTSEVRRVIDTAVGRIEGETRLDAVAARVAVLLERALPPGGGRDLLRGEWLGHPLHPVLTDLPIGAWTSAWILDVVGGRRGESAAQLLVGFGCLSAVPTALSGASDWLGREKMDRRVGVVHAGANAAALVLYTMSWRQRRAGRRVAGIALGHAGATMATAGGLLGGHLAFRPERGAEDESDSETRRGPLDVANGGAQWQPANR